MKRRDVLKAVAGALSAVCFPWRTKPENSGAVYCKVGDGEKKIMDVAKWTVSRSDGLLTPDEARRLMNCDCVTFSCCTVIEIPCPCCGKLGH